MVVGVEDRPSQRARTQLGAAGADGNHVVWALIEADGRSWIAHPSFRRSLQLKRFLRPFLHTDVYTQQAMGNDGGSIPDRRDLVRSKPKVCIQN